MSLRLPRFSGIWIGTAVLFAVGYLINPKTVSESSIYSMLPFFAILAIASIGQTLVVMQRGLDLSVPGAVAAAAVAFSRRPMSRTTASCPASSWRCWSWPWPGSSPASP